MLQTLKNAWKLPDVRKKMIYVVVILLIYRIGTVIPVPFIDASNFDATFGNTIFAYMDTLSGGALSSATLFALGISPYITSSIVMQLLAVAIPALERLSKEGEEGKKKINSITRYVTVALAVITAIGYYMLLANNGMLVKGAAKGESSYWFLYAVVIIVAFCAGASVVMWLGEKINENGIGNGISLILFANIIQTLPSILIRLWNITAAGFGQTAAKGVLGLGLALFVIIALLVMTVFDVFVTGSERRIPVQYAKRVVGRKMYGGQNTNLPIQLNMSGVMPVIFASSIISLPATIMTLCGVTDTSKGFWGGLYRFMSPNGWFYPVMLFVLIIAFAYFYITISFNPVEVSNNLKKNGGMIPGIRQGRPTAEYISKILSKITLLGALFLSIIAILPIIANPLVITPILEVILGAGNDATIQSLASSLTFGGTSLLIVVGVALETARELEAQLTMRNYKGFLS